MPDQPDTARISTRSGLVRIAAAATVWGSIPLFVRWVDASPLVIVFWRLVFECGALAVVMALRGTSREFLTLPARTRAVLAGMGALLALNWVLFFIGLKLTDVAVAVLLAYTGPILVAVLGPLILREPRDRRLAAPLALAALGTALVVSPGGLSLDARHIAGAAAALASAFTYAALVLNAKRLIRGISTDVYMLAESLAAALLLLPAALLLPSPDSAREWVGLATLGIVHTALTGMLFLSGLRAVRADHAAALTYAEPAAAVLFAAAFLGEPVTVTSAAGGVAIVCAGLAVARLRPVAAPEQMPAAGPPSTA